MFNSRATDSSASVTANQQRSAVPISVYRQLAGELQHSQSEVADLKQQNQKLLRQNQRLRQEVEKVSLALRNLQQINAEYDDYGNPLPPGSPPRSPAAPPASTQPAPPPPFHFPGADDERNFVGEVQEQPRPSARSATSGDVGGWLLGVAIALIALTTFGIAFFAMRPLLTNNSNNG